MKLIKPEGWADYELIDTGEQEKLERFGKFILWRPEPQAVWSKSINSSEWEKLYNAKFIRKKSQQTDNFEKGEWIVRKMPEQWQIQYIYKSLKMRLRLGLTSFGHIGVFPEQSDNWNFIYDTITSNEPKPCRVLNLFAYTGGSTIAARQAGAEVTHVDSVRQVITWSHENAEINQLKDIRWVVEDALKFAKKEARRNNKYNGIILDPPAYGRGPEGEKWQLKDSINELIGICSELADKNNFFMVLSLYSMGYSALIADNLINSYFKNINTKDYGELYFEDRAGQKLPLGIYLRFKNS